MQSLPASLRTCCLVAALAAALPAGAAADTVRLSAPPGLVETGLLGYVLPRFSLKSGVRIERVGPEAEAEIALVPEGRGRPVFSGQGRTWRMRVRDRDHPGAARFADWLTSEIGRRTIAAFRPGGAPLFTPAAPREAETAKPDYAGDAGRGLALSRVHCGRCHAVNDATRFTSIGSTPSFFVLRGLPDWDGRFRGFYAINPHPAFTQVSGVTAPFPVNRPPPIVPVEITLEELDHILAYVAGLDPADLGAPLKHQ